MASNNHNNESNEVINRTVHDEVAPPSDNDAPDFPLIDSDADSAIAGFSDTTSVRSMDSSLYEHVEENGRTYHRFKQGKYLLPNDEEEQVRLEIQHVLFGVTFRGKLYLAPIGDNPENVLDIATGTGAWAIDFAQQHPQSEVIGTDLSAIQPLYVPPNCRFEIDDAEDEWVFDRQFNFIHWRALLTCFTDPSAVMRSAFNSLAPGGYLEMQDGTFPFQYIGEPPINSAFYRWSNLVTEGAAIGGRPWTNGVNYKRWMEEIGFEDVVEVKFFWPINTWAKGAYLKEIGSYVQKDLLQGLEGLSLKVLGKLGWSAEEVRTFVEEVRKDLYNPAIHGYLPVSVVYGRKPGGPPKASISSS